MAHGSQESRASLLPPGFDVGHTSSMAAWLALVGPHIPLNPPGLSGGKKTMIDPRIITTLMTPETGGPLTGGDGSSMGASLVASGNGGREPLMPPSQPASPPEVVGPGILSNKTPSLERLFHQSLPGVSSIPTLPWQCSSTPPRLTSFGGGGFLLLW